jgi:hypothetical protein
MSFNLRTLEKTSQQDYRKLKRFGGVEGDIQDYFGKLIEIKHL